MGSFLPLAGKKMLLFCAVMRAWTEGWQRKQEEMAEKNKNGGEPSWRRTKLEERREKKEGN